MAAGSFPTKNRAEVSGRKNLQSDDVNDRLFFWFQSSAGCHIMHTRLHVFSVHALLEIKQPLQFSGRNTHHTEFESLGSYGAEKLQWASSIYQQFSQRKRLWPSKTCLTLLGAHFWIRFSKRRQIRTTSIQTYRLSESQTCNLFIEHVDSNQQEWRMFKLVMQCCCWRIKAHSFTQSHAAPKHPEVISFHWELVISRAWMLTTNGSHRKHW